MERRNFLLKPRLVSNYARRQMVENTLDSIEWWRVKSEVTRWERLETADINPWWRAELDLDGADIPEDDFEDGFNASGVTRIQLRDMTVGSQEPAHEWDPYDRADQVLLLQEGHHFGSIPPVEEERPREMPRATKPLPPVTYTKYIEGVAVVHQQSTEVWWMRGTRRRSAVAHMAKQIVDTKRRYKTYSGVKVMRVALDAVPMCASNVTKDVYTWQGPLPDELCIKCQNLYEQKMRETPANDTVDA